MPFEQQIPLEEIDKWMADYQAGMSQADIARKYDVAPTTVQYHVKKRGLGVGAQKPKKKKTEKEITEVNQLQGKLALAQDEIRNLKQQLQVAQKADMTLKALAEQLDDMISPVPPPYPMWKKQQRGPVKETCVLHLSDGHHDLVVLPHMVQDYERHDFNISMARAENLVETVIDYTQNNLALSSFDTLWVLAYGDHTSGEIHGSDKRSHFGNMMRNCLAIGQLHAQMLRELSAWFPNVKVLYLSGNHGRRKEVRKKDYHAAWDSWDYLIGEIAKSHLRDCVNVDILIPDSFSAVVEIEDWNFCCFHGDDIKGWAGIPWYGICRKTQRLTALSSAHDRRIDYYCMGHFHALGVQQSIKSETIVNGSWVGCDPFVFNALDGYNEPMQLLHGVHKRRGATWRLPIKLRFPEEVEGPKRYTVSLAQPEG